jgi:hypothetical protein
MRHVRNCVQKKRNLLPSQHRFIGANPNDVNVYDVKTERKKMHEHTTFHCLSSSGVRS